MGKFKPHKGLLKRIRITKSGKIKCRVANGSHLRSLKSPERLRGMRHARYISNHGLLRRVTHLLGRSLANGKTQQKQEVTKHKTQSTKAKTGRAIREESATA